MATKSQKIKVGAFVIAGLFVVVNVFLIVSERRKEPSEIFRIKFEESVMGLTRDSDVLYQGVPVGKVEDIRVTDKNDIIVTVGIFTDRVRLKKGTVATLQVSNLMGGMVIELSGGDPRAVKLEPGSEIPSKPSVLENIAQDLPRILDEIKGILAKFDRAIGTVEGGQLGELVRSSNDAVQEINAFLKSTKVAMLNTEYEVTQTMRTLREAIVEIERTFTRLNEDPSSIMWGRPRPKKPYVE